MQLELIWTTPALLMEAGSRVSTQTSLYIGIGGFGAVPNGIMLKEGET